MRKAVLEKSALNVNLSYILSNRRIPFDISKYCGINVIDDCHGLRIDDLNILNKYHKIYNICSISNIDLEHYKAFCNSWDDTNSKINVSFSGIRLSKIFEIYNPSKSIFLCDINAENITQIYPKDRWKLSSMHCKYNSDLMPRSILLQNIDYLANEINKYAKSDVDKVILLNKIIKENITYDFKCNEESLVKKRNPNFISFDSYNGIHLGHYVQSIFIRKEAVCSAIAEFATLILNHPLLNIKTKYISNKNVIDNHAWNNVCIDNTWYTCDFTWTIYYNSPDILKYVLIKPRCKNDSKYNFYEYSNFNYNRKMLLESSDRLKDVHIKIPENYRRNSESFLYKNFVLKESV